LFQHSTWFLRPVEYTQEDEMTAAIDIRGVTRIYNPGSYQPVKALDNVSLTINDNEFFTSFPTAGGLLRGGQT
jgi:hypothetical protein